MYQKRACVDIIVKQPPMFHWPALRVAEGIWIFVSVLQVGPLIGRYVKEAAVTVRTKQ